MGKNRKLNQYKLILQNVITFTFRLEIHHFIGPSRKVPIKTT